MSRAATDRGGYKAHSAALPSVYRRCGGEHLALVPASLVEVTEGRGTFFVTILDGLPGAGQD
jgi:hypothetical protein